MHQTISVILKRQVPIRFDEAHRSWLGGLPMMPRLTEWPRDGEGAPLHFIAQICCADLPKPLWNGLGPREGRLLLFVETLKLEDEAENSTVQVLHTTRLGSEREPPEDVPSVRHSMSGHFDHTASKNQDGVPKLWRKWPVDIVVQEYDTAKLEPEDCIPPIIEAEKLYDGAVSQKGINGTSFDLDRPLTWLGARYIIEGVLQELEKGNFKSGSDGLTLLLDAPDFDPLGREKEIEERALQSPDYKGGQFSSQGRYRELYDRLTAELSVERRVGWVDRAYQAFDAEISLFKAAKMELEQAEAAGIKDATARKGDVILSMKGVLWNLERFEGYKEQLQNVLAQFPEPDPEAALTQEIQEQGKLFLDWVDRLKNTAKCAIIEIEAHDPDAVITAQQWEDMAATLSESSPHFWGEGLNTLHKKSREFRFDRHVQTAAQEDLLDLYTQGKLPSGLISKDLIDDLEARAKYIEPGLPHRLGGAS
ncbi:DUF1963 domain-containing protein [Marimonas sp. MJW-29]|uniref:DUF1963 domain-containing protein n=1 Tax=Sulfitobacter sediminis TaxID=3234186 RepID=A0ABV3RVU9_9RHOB